MCNIRTVPRQLFTSYRKVTAQLPVVDIGGTLLYHRSYTVAKYAISPNHTEIITAAYLANGVHRRKDFVRKLTTRRN